MDFPQRIDTHIFEKESLDVLSSTLPKEWIIREITERDYGIDLYVEIVRQHGQVRGDLIALQVKSARDVKFNRKNITSRSDIKRATLNYWNGIPIPVFVILVDLGNGIPYWCNIKSEIRTGKYYSDSQTVTVYFNKCNSFDGGGLERFYRSYIREKNWSKVENAIEKSLMAFNTLGPLVLMIRRKYWRDGCKDYVCSTTIQYLFIEHYQYFEILSMYFKNSRPKKLSEWYDRNVEICNNLGVKPSLNFTSALMNELIEYFVSSYRDSILMSHEYVMGSHKEYFLRSKPYLYMHLLNRPHTFHMDDWFTRYFFDEYENETEHPEMMFFEDFTAFDWMLEDLLKS